MPLCSQSEQQQIPPCGHQNILGVQRQQRDQLDHWKVVYPESAGARGRGRGERSAIFFQGPSGSLQHHSQAKKKKKIARFGLMKISNSTYSCTGRARTNNFPDFTQPACGAECFPPVLQQCLSWCASQLPGQEEGKAQTLLILILRQEFLTVLSKAQPAEVTLLAA